MTTEPVPCRGGFWEPTPGPLPSIGRCTICKLCIAAHPHQHRPRPLSCLKLILVDLNAELCEGWRIAFAGVENVEVVHGRFEAIPDFDCMVSAANSFGLMDGGVDLAIAKFFGPVLVAHVQQLILKEFAGEQPVGSSMLVATGHEQHRFLAHTPTMRVPKSISGTDNVYLAMRAMLIEVQREPGIRTVACPGLGTLTGRVSARSAAAQMALAYDSVCNPPTDLVWPFASTREMAIALAVGVR